MLNASRISVPAIPGQHTYYLCCFQCIIVAARTYLMRYMFYTILIASLTFLAGMQTAQAQFVLSAQLRTRAEMNHGYKFIPDTTAIAQYYVMQRTRLNADYQRDKLSFRLSVQDVRAWGGEDNYTATGVLGDESGLDIFEAWASLPLGEKWRLKLGRQSFRYDDQRLLGLNDWNPYAISYDAMLWTYRPAGWEMDLALSWNSRHEKILGDPGFDNDYYTDRNRIRMLHFLYLRKNLGESLYLSGLGILSGYQQPGTRNTLQVMATTGLFARYDKDGVQAEASAYYQGGHQAFGMPVSAWMMSANIRSRWGAFTGGIGADMLSGHDASNTNPDYVKTDHAFDILYGGRFIFNGWMNQFVNLKPTTRQGGLVDVYPSLQWHISQNQDLEVVWHLFRLQNKVRDTHAATTAYLDKALGSEWDLMYTHKFSREILLKAGFSWYQTSRSMEILKGVYGKAAPAYWGWVMLQVSPELFRH